jgi:DNA-binding transcriptional ArsR family regulator
MDNESMDPVFQALAHASRRKILDLLKAAPGATVCEVAGHFEESRINVMKHLRILETAGLVVSEKKGRTRRLYFNAVPIQLIYDRWTSEYSALWASRLTRIKYQIESRGKGRDENRKGRVQGVHQGKNRGRVA